MRDVNIGIIGDSFNEHTANDVLEALVQHDLDAIVALGNMTSDVTNMQSQFDIKQIMERQIATALQLYDKMAAKKGTTVYWLAGPNEDYDAYTKAFEKLDGADQLDYVIDASNLKTTAPFKVNGADLEFAFIPGAVMTRGFMVNYNHPSGLYRVGNQTIRGFNPNELRQMVENPANTVVFAHFPCYIPGEDSIDIAIFGDDGIKQPGRSREDHIALEFGSARPIMQHMGDRKLTPILKELGIRAFISGNIKEAAGIVDINGNPIGDGEYVPRLFGSPGPSRYGDYGILTLRADGTSCLRRFNINGQPTDFRHSLVEPYTRKQANEQVDDLHRDF